METTDTVREVIEARHALTSHSELVRLGMTGAAMRRALKDGWLVHPRRDAYVARRVWESSGEDERHALIVQSISRGSPDTIFCIRSAASIHKIPVVGSWRHPPQVLVPAGTNSNSRLSLTRHEGPYDPNTTTVGRVRVTSMERTIADIARIDSFASGLVAADHALQCRATTRNNLAQVIASLGSRKGVRRARNVLKYAEELSESPGESLSRARILELGYQLPQLQVRLVGDDGNTYRVDYYWPKLRLIAKFDGRVKYGRTYDRTGEAPGDIVYREKLREDALRRAGDRIVRWTWDDAIHPHRLDGILQRAGVPLAH